MSMIQRQSNFELLRILSMLGVLTNHVLQNCYPDLHSGDFSIANEFRILLMNISIIAVNCFVMISGYFRIRQSIHSFLSLYIQLIFYSALFSVIGYSFGELSLQDTLLRIFFPFTEGGMWFMVAYLGLYLIAPILNMGYDSLNAFQRHVLLGCFIIVDIYLGYMHQSPEVSVDGYHMIHFLCLYYIGMYISTMRKCLTNLKLGLSWSGIVILMTMMHAIKMVWFPITIFYSMRYNSPMVMFASVVFFMWVQTWKLQSKTINWIAVSVLSVYVIHSQPVVSSLFFGFLKDVSQSSNINIIMSAVILVISTLMLFALCISLDKFRIFICAPIVKTCTAWIEQAHDRLTKYSCS